MEQPFSAEFFLHFFWEKGLLRGPGLCHVGCLKPIEVKWLSQRTMETLGSLGQEGGRGRMWHVENSSPLMGVNGAQGLLQKHQPDSPKFAKNKHIP